MVDFVNGTGMSGDMGFQARPMLRIAFPAWRIKAKNRPQMSDAGPVVSRDEVQSMLDVELKARKRRPCEMTDHERWQMKMNTKLRKALSQGIPAA